MWTTEKMPDQTGKSVVITGANSGIGFETALALYKAGANVILTGRDADAVGNAAVKIAIAEGSGSVSQGILDLSSFQSIERFTDRFLAEHQKLDLLINNAGVMTPPESKTTEGFEQQFGVNFLGHFMLTAKLFPLLKKVKGARIVTLSSGAHHYAKGIDYDNLKIEKGYDAFREYAISKLADLLFTTGLQKRIDQLGFDLLSVAAHPGVTKSGLARHMAKADYDAALEQFGDLMPAWQGALPSLFAATSAEVNKGAYYGPDGENELFGYPAPARLSEAASSEKLADELWAFAENRTGLIFPF